MNELKQRKKKLTALEEHLRQVVERDSTELEQRIKEILKVGAIVGGSLFLGYKIFRLIRDKTAEESIEEDNGGDSAMDEAPKGNVKSGSASNLKHRLVAVLAALLYREFSRSIVAGRKKVEESLDED